MVSVDSRNKAVATTSMYDISNIREMVGLTKAAEPKELYIVEGAEYIDLYDKTEFIPFDKLDNFFKKYL